MFILFFLEHNAYSTPNISVGSVFLVFIQHNAYADYFRGLDTSFFIEHNAYADFFRGLDTKENAKDRVLVDAILSPRVRRLIVTPNQMV